MEKRLEAKHVFRYDISLDVDLESVYIYTNIDFCEKLGDDESDTCEVMNKVEDHIQNLVFTKEKIEELKKKVCEKIMNTDNPFYIQCGDWDGGYYIDSENDLLENKIAIE